MTTPLRLCAVFPHVVLGGGETAMLEVLAGLAAGMDVAVCALDNQPLAGEVTIRAELAARFGRSGDIAFVRRRWELRPRFARADAVLWYGVVNAVPAVLAALPRRPASIRVVHTDRAVDGPGFQRRWGRVIDATVAVSPAVARRIPGAVFVPNPVAPERLQGGRCELFAPGRPTLGWLGRLVPQKNVAWLLDSLPALGCNLALQALDTPLQTAAGLARRAAALGVGDRVCFLPPGRDVGTLLRSVDALVVASRHEGFPMVVVEAGAAGTPVIATRVGALPELFAAEVLFVDSENGVPSLPGLRAALARLGPGWGERLRERVARLCDRDAVVRGYAAVVRAAVAGVEKRSRER